MTDKRAFVYIALLLAIVISSPCRFSAGLVLMLFFNCVIFIGAAVNHLSYRAQQYNLSAPLVICATVFFTVLYRQLLILFSPIIALSTGISLYITAFCAYQTGQYAKPEEESFMQTAPRKLAKSGKFSASALLIFFIRETFGMGTISLPAPQSLSAPGMLEIRLPHIKLFESFAFLATIPGAVILLAVIMAVTSVMWKRSADV